MKKKFPFFRQLDQMDCGPTCLRMISKHFGRTYEIAYLRQISNLAREGATLGSLADAAEKIGLSTMAITTSLKDLTTELPLPCIAYWRQRHYVVVYEVSNSIVKVADPAHGLIDYKIEEFCKGSFFAESPASGTLRSSGLKII